MTCGRVFLGAASLAVLLVGVAVPRSARGQASCCMDRDSNGVCGPLDTPLSCSNNSSLVVRSPFPIVCESGAVLQCRNISFGATQITIAGSITGAFINLQATPQGIDLRGATLNVSRRLALRSAGGVLTDLTTSILPQTGTQPTISIKAVGDVSVSTLPLVGGPSVSIVSSTGNVTATGGDYEGRIVRIWAPQGHLDLTGSTVLGGNNIALQAGQGFTAPNSFIRAQGPHCGVQIRVSGGNTDLSGATVIGTRAVQVEALSQVGQNVTLASALVQTARAANITVRSSGTLDVTGTTLQAAPPGAVKLAFRDPLSGTPASMTGGTHSQSEPLGMPPTGSQDATQLTSDAFTVPLGMDRLSFQYLFVTNEAAPDLIHNDTFVAYVTGPGAQPIATFVDTASPLLAPAQPPPGLPFPAPLPFAFAMPRFHTATLDVSRFSGTGAPLQVVFSVEDIGDSAGASAALIDNIALRSSQTGATVPIGTFESGDLTGFTLSFNVVSDPFGGVIRGLGFDSAPQGLDMAILSTGTDLLAFVDPVPQNPNALVCGGQPSCATPTPLPTGTPTDTAAPSATPTATPPSTPTPTSTCAPTGVACSSGSTCCSGVCTGGTCV